MSATGLFSDVPNKESTAEWRSSMGALRRGFQGGTPLDTVATNAVAKLAALSQKEYSEKTITLYRGVNAGQLRALKDSGVLKVGALSSWTEDRKIAATFGNTIKAEVPREQVAMSWRACPGLSAEQEVVLACKGGIRVSTLRTESIGLSYVSVNVANIVILLVSDESEIGSVDGYDDWLHKK
jgi:hypothetical protein